MSAVTSQLDELIAHHDIDHHGIGSSFTDPARAELAQLRATVAAQATAIRDVRQQLRATSENWREDCLYRADAILSAALGEEVHPAMLHTKETSSE